MSRGKSKCLLGLTNEVLRHFAKRDVCQRSFDDAFSEVEDLCQKLASRSEGLATPSVEGHCGLEAGNIELPK